MNCLLWIVADSSQLPALHFTGHLLSPGHLEWLSWVGYSASIWLSRQDRLLTGANLTGMRTLLTHYLQRQRINGVADAILWVQGTGGVWSCKATCQARRCRCSSAVRLYIVSYSINALCRIGLASGWGLLWWSCWICACSPATCVCRAGPDPPGQAQADALDEDLAGLKQALHDAGSDLYNKLTSQEKAALVREGFTHKDAWEGATEGTLTGVLRKGSIAAFIKCFKPPGGHPSACTPTSDSVILLVHLACSCWRCTMTQPSCCILCFIACDRHPRMLPLQLHAYTSRPSTWASPGLQLLCTLTHGNCMAPFSFNAAQDLSQAQAQVRRLARGS
jgi:hypothetical protein